MKEFEDYADKSIMDLFEKPTLIEHIRKVLYGLKQPKDTGDYKWSKFQMTRLWSPISSILIPLFVVLLCCMMGSNYAPQRTITVTVLEPEQIEDLQEIEEIIEVPKFDTQNSINTEITDFTIDSNSEFVEDNSPTIQDFSPMPSIEDSVAIIKSPVTMKGIIGSRSPGQRGKASAKFGAPSGNEDAVIRALRWLKKNQNDDGSWDKTKPAMTGLALLSFLAHGETPVSDEFGYTVQKAMQWLCDNQEDNGHFKGRDGHDYSHPIAAYALAESFALTKIPMVKYVAEKAIDIVIKGQHPNGGWDYNCKQSERDDTSYMGWCAQSLKAAKLAQLDCEGLERAIKNAPNGFKKNYKHGNYEGTFGYTGPGNTGLTGVGVLCLQLLGEANSREVTHGLMALENATFNWNGGGIYNKNYYWYYITQAKFHAGGKDWNVWNKMFSTTLVKEQTIINRAIKDYKGNLVDIGYWEMDKDITGHTDGVVMDTCLCVLQLEVYYRYLPTFQPPKEIEAQVGIDKNEIEVDIVL